MRKRLIVLALIALPAFPEAFLPFIHAGAELGYTGNLYRDATKMSDVFGRAHADGGWNWRVADGIINRTRIDAEYDYYAVNPYATFFDGMGNTSFELHPLDGVLLTAHGSYRIFIDDAARFVNRFITNDNGRAHGSAGLSLDITEGLVLAASYSFDATSYFAYDLDSMVHAGELLLTIRPSLFTAIAIFAGYDTSAYPERHTLVLVTNTLLNETATRADQHVTGGISFTSEDVSVSYTVKAQGFWRESNGDSAIATNSVVTTNGIDKDYYDETGGSLAFTLTLTPAEGTTFVFDIADRVSYFPLRSSLDRNNLAVAASTMQNYLTVSLDAEHALVRGDHGISIIGSIGYFRSDSGDFYTQYDGVDIRAGIRFWL